MFSKTSQFYDKIYSFKNYAEEAQKIKTLIIKLHPKAKEVLDVACGTGEHIKYLSKDFAMDGIDLEPGLLEIAKEKNPSSSFFVADMKEFKLEKKYDVILCLFSSIGYLKKGEEVIEALKSFKNHLKPSGIMAIEPWFTPDVWKTGNPHLITVNETDLKICRMNISEVEGNISKLRFHYLIGDHNSVEHVTEDHELALYTIDEMVGFFKRANLIVEYDPVGIFGRGLYIAKI